MHVIHKVEFRVNDSFGRLASMALTYVEIAEDSYLELKALKKKRVKKPVEYADHSEFDQWEKSLIRAAVKTTVFAAMAIEAAIFDLAAIHLTDDFARKYLDKSDLAGKWAIVPALICGKSLELTGPAMNSLNSLIKDRNALVHYKSSPMPKNTPEEYGRIAAEGAKAFSDTLRSAEDALKTVFLLSMELDRTFGTPTSVLGYYGKRPKGAPLSPKQQALLPLVDRCREIEGNHLKEKGAGKPSRKAAAAKK